MKNILIQEFQYSLQSQLQMISKNFESICDREYQSESFSITKISFPDSIEIDDNVTLINAEPSMNWTFRGIPIDWSDDHENASDSTRVNCEFDSNAIDERDAQRERHFNSRISTFFGIMIDWSDDPKNAPDSIRVKHEFDSNVIDESDWQNIKTF
jgi:hypothetical protein